MASIKNYGISGVGADVQFGKNGGRFQYDSANATFSFSNSAGTGLESISVANVAFANLNDGSITVEQFDNDSALTANSAVRIPTQQAVKSYVDDVTNSGGMLIAADTGNGSGAIVFADETLTIVGTDNQITTFFDGTNTVRIEIDTNPVLEGNVVANISLTTPTANVGTLSFTGGGVDVTSIIDDDTMASASATTLATSESIKAYVDNELAAGGLALNLEADGGTSGSIVFSSEVLTLSGTANQIVTSFADPANVTFALADDVTLPGNLTLQGIGTHTVGGTLDADTVEFNSLSGTGSVSVTDIIDDDTMASASATTLATSESIKAYVDAEVADFSAVLNVSDSGTSGDIDLDAETLTIQGTTNEVSVSFDGTDTFTVGLPDDVTVGGNLSVTGNLLSNDITAAAISIDGNATITGDLTVLGTTTTINSTVVTVDDAVFRVNAQGVSVDAGIEANISGSIKQLVWDASESEWSVFTETFSAGTLTDGTASLSSGSLSSAVNGTFSGTVSFGSLTDSGESITVTKFVDEADGITNNDNDTTIPTSAAVTGYVEDYVTNNGGDGLMLRNTFTANSSDTTFDIGTVPNVSARTYYADKIVLKVTTAFAGDSFNHILVKENGGSGTVLVTADDAEGAEAGTYVIELDGSFALTKNASIQVQFVQANGSTASAVTSGAVTATAHYNWV